MTTIEGARADVQELAPRKMPIVKTWVDDRGGADKDARRRNCTGAIIDEAHKHGMRVAVHATELSDAKDLLRAGIDIFAHMISDVDDEVVALFKQHPDTVGADGARRHLTASLRALAQSGAPTHRRDCAAGADLKAAGSAAHIETLRSGARDAGAWDRLARGLKRISCRPA